MPRHTINPDLRPLDPDALSDHDIDELSREEALDNGTFRDDLKRFFTPPIHGGDRGRALDMFVGSLINQGIHRGCCRDLRASKATQERATRIDAILAQSKLFTLEDASVVVRDLQDQIDGWKKKAESATRQIQFMRDNIPYQLKQALMYRWACLERDRLAKSSNQG